MASSGYIVYLLHLRYLLDSLLHFHWKEFFLFWAGLKTLSYHGVTFAFLVKNKLKPNGDFTNLMTGDDIMKDRVIAGALAGVIGAVLQDIYGCLIKFFGLTDRGFIDFARAVILYNVTDGGIETLLALIAHIIWDLLLGILFVYIIQGTSSSHYYLKALIYGLSLWFIIQAVGTLFRLPMFFHIPACAALLTLIGALIYSFGIAVTLRFFEKKSNVF
jgi:hypothetical protein